MKVSLCILGKGIPSGQIFIHLTSGTQAVFQLPTVSLDEGTFVHAHTTHMYTADLSHILKNSRFNSQEEKTSPRPSNENTINFKIVSLIFNLCIYLCDTSEEEKYSCSQITVTKHIRKLLRMSNT